MIRLLLQKAVAQTEISAIFDRLHSARSGQPECRSGASSAGKHTEDKRETTRRIGGNSLAEWPTHQPFTSSVPGLARQVLQDASLGVGHLRERSERKESFYSLR